MNIFILDKDPIKAAQMLCDKHIVKMPTESMQMICTNLKEMGWEKTLPMKSVMLNHRCTKWARKSKENLIWLINHCEELCKEYTKRYNRIHKIEQYLKELIDGGLIGFIENQEYEEKKLTDFALAMPDIYQSKNVVESYRDYYLKEKSYFAKWKSPSSPPSWWVLPMKG